MALRPVEKVFRGAAAGLAMLGMAFSPAFGQDVAQAVIIGPTVVAPTMSPLPTSRPGVSADDCRVFKSYVADEFRDFSGKFSPEFVRGVARFVKAGCAARDDQGEIQIITMNHQDGVSLLTVRMRQRRTDVLEASGVARCDRPAKGVCPSTNGAAVPAQGDGG